MNAPPPLNILLAKKRPGNNEHNDEMNYDVFFTHACS